MNEEIENSAVAQVDSEVAESVSSAENRDKLTAQLEAYKRCFAALQTELAEIEQQFGAEPKPADDQLKELTGEVSAFKGELSELRRILEELRNAPAPAPAPAVQSPVLPMLQQQPQQQYYYQSPMVTPTLPYLQTPSFAPLMPAMPNFNR